MLKILTTFDSKFWNDQIEPNLRDTILNFVKDKQSN